MGLMDALKGLASGRGKGAVEVPLQPGEVLIRRSLASARPGTPTSVGGDLLVTNQRIVFSPLDTRDLVEALTWGLNKAGAPGGTDKVIGAVGKAVSDTASEATLGGIIGARAGSEPSLSSPPTLLIEASDGSVREIGILASRLSRNGSPANARERDLVLEAIRSAVAGS